MNIEGKTISKITKMKKPGFDDTGFLKVEFTDGSVCLITASYDGYTGDSQDEYPTTIDVCEFNDDGELVPAEPNFD